MKLHAATASNPIQSFAIFEDAIKLCDLLSGETGHEYAVTTDNDKGYSVSRIKENPQHEKPPVNAARSGQLFFRQAFRGFLEHYVQLSLGVFLIVKPYVILAWAVAYLKLEELPEWFNLKGYGEAVSIIGGLLLIYSLRFVYSYFALNLRFEPDGMMVTKGIIARDQVKIRFDDIKTVGINQGIIERLLGIGTIHLASAGTNGEVDIIFRNLVNPVQVRQRVQKLMHSFSRRHV